MLTMAPASAGAHYSLLVPCARAGVTSMLPGSGSPSASTLWDIAIRVVAHCLGGRPQIGQNCRHPFNLTGTKMEALGD